MVRLTVLAICQVNFVRNQFARLLSGVIRAANVLPGAFALPGANS
jgi:hypothetical protein